MQQLFRYLLISFSEQAINAPNPSDRIGIWGIIATVVGVIISFLVTWIFAQKGRKEMKLDYQIAAVPLLSNASIVDVSKRTLDIQYNGQKIGEPYMLIVDVYNTGNVAIKDINIVVKSKDGYRIMPGYIDNVPAGYEDKWSVREVLGDLSATTIHLDFINPKQVLNTRCYLDGKPDKGFSFECPLPDVQINESKLSVNLDSPKGSFWDSRRKSLGNLILAGVILILFVTVNMWTSRIDSLFYILCRSYGFRVYYGSTFIPMFVFSTLIAALIWNALGLGAFDKYLLKRKSTKILAVISLIVSLIGALCVEFCVFINSPLEEIISISAVIIISLSIHALMIIHQQ